MDSNTPAMVGIRVPNVQQGPKLVGTGSVGDSNQGTAVAISADGNTAVVGASNDNEGLGSLWVFIRQQGQWIQQGNKLQGSGGVLAPGLGTSVAISADGNTIVAGGPGDNDLVGAAWVFVRILGAWTQMGDKLVADTPSSSPPMQGAAVAISGDGKTIAVGGNGDDYATGATWIYRRSESGWTQRPGKLVGIGYEHKVGQGASLAMSADGKTLIVGTSFEGSANAPVWVFTQGDGRNSTQWVQQGPCLLTSDSVQTQPAQNTSVSVSADGNTFVLGKNCDDNLTGAAWIFARTADQWAQQGSKLLASDAVNPAQQGASVSISADGRTAVVGGNTDDGNVGAMWTYANSSGAWAQAGTKLVGTGAAGNAFQGNAVAISADGSTALSGGFGDNGLVGATWVFIAATPAKT